MTALGNPNGDAPAALLAPLGADELEARFDATAALTIGLEEEVLLLDPGTLDLAPVAASLLRRAPHPAVKLELPAAQLELVTTPVGSVREAVAQLAAGRRSLADLTSPIALPAAAGAHPFAAPLGRLNTGERYDAIRDEYGDIARTQLVCALQVHVAVGGAARTLAVYNALRGHLPELAALAGNAPFHAGRDTGLASVRPLVSDLLPRQGIPPVIASWTDFAETLRWGAVSGAVPEPRRWWWELRPHVAYGTLELRTPDAQTTVTDAAGVVAFAQALVAWLSQRDDAGEPLGAHDSWRIAENRGIACRHGLEGHFADLDTGLRRPVRDVLYDRLETLQPIAAQLGCTAELAHAGALVEANGAVRQRAIEREHGLHGLTRWLADRYLDPQAGSSPASSV